MSGRYELVRRLAGGGMGEVFAAQMRGAEGFTKPVALKRIYPHLAGDPKHRQLFVREAKIVAQLSHPNIVQVIELGNEGDELFMAMEFVQGISLGQLLATQSSNALPANVVSVIASDLLDALAYAHAFSDPVEKIDGIVHADVSPQNIMLTREGRAKLCDFGVAKLLRSGSYEATRRGRWGKAAYMAPEQLSRDQLDARTDVYAVAITMIEAVTGKRPYAGNAVDVMRAVVNGERIPTGELAPHVDPKLIEVLDRGAAIDLDVRYQTASAMRRALIDVVGNDALDSGRAWLQDLVRSESAAQPVTNDPATHALTASGLIDLPPENIPAEPTVVRTVIAQFPKQPPVRRIVPLMVAIAVAAMVTLVLVLRTIESTAAESKPRVSASSTTDPAARPAETPSTVQPAVTLAAAPKDNEREPVRRPRPAKPATISAPAVSNAPPASITLNSAPWAYVTIDGKRLEKTTPLLDFKVPPGRHVVELSAANGKTTRFTLDLAPGESVQRAVKVE